MAHREIPGGKGLLRPLSILEQELRPTALRGGPFFIPNQTMNEHLTLIREANIKPADMEGREWDVTVIGAETPDDIVTIEGQQFILSKNGRLYLVEALKESVPQWDGIKVFDNHLTDDEFEKKQGMRSPATEWLGTLVKPRWDEAKKQIRATFKVVEDALATKLKNAWEAGVLNTVGLSIDTFPIIEREAEFEGQRLPIIEGFKKILSVDLVGDPAAGGGFNRLMAATATPNKEQTIMDPKELEQAVDDLLAQKLGTVVQAAVADALAASAQQETEVQAEDAEPVAEETQPDNEPDEEDTEAEEGLKVEDIQEDVRKLEGRLLLRDKLEEAKLDGPYREAVSEIFEGQLYDEKQLDEVIKKMKKAQADKDPSGRVSENGTQRGTVEVGLSGAEKAEIEIMRLVMGGPKFQELEHNTEDFVKDRIKEGRTYKSWINAGKPNTGNYNRLSTIVRDLYGFDPTMDNRALETSTTTTLSTIVKNTVNIWVAADYSLQDRWYEQLVNTEEVETIDDATLARTYGIPELPVVNEGGTYLSLGMDDEEETASYVKRGGFEGVTMETIMRDKVNEIRNIPRKLSDAWFNTLSSQTAGVFTTNSDAGPVLGTTGALFNATAVTSAGGHANLLTAALSFTSYGAARTAMRKQTNRPLGVGRKLQMPIRFLLVAEDLETTALQIRNSEMLPNSANNDVNPFFQQFDVVVVPDWTDTNNFALVADPQRFPAIWHIFPRGNRTPALFTADNESAGSVFTNDTFRFKVRMMTYEFSSIYRVSPVSDFRPLHKSNVA